MSGSLPSRRPAEPPDGPRRQLSSMRRPCCGNVMNGRAPYWLAPDCRRCPGPSRSSLDDGLGIVAAELGGEDVFQALADLEGQIGRGAIVAEVVGEIEAVETFLGGPEVDAFVEGEAFEEVIAIATGEQVLDAEVAQLGSESKEMVAGDATHAGGDADAQGGVVAVVVERAFKRDELDAGSLGDGTGDAEFEVFLVVEGEGDDSLAVRSGTENGAGIQAAAKRDGGFA